MTLPTALQQRASVVLTDELDLDRISGRAASLGRLALFLGPCVESLRATLALNIGQGEVLRTSRVLATATRAELTLYVQSGWRVGCAVHLVWKAKAPKRADVRVLVFSRAQKWITWTAFAASIVAGLALARALVPTSVDPPGRFIAGFLGGSLVGVAMTILVDRLGVGRDTSTSLVRARKVAEVVTQWLALQQIGQRPATTKRKGDE